jgi:hypothetical protein
MACLFGVDLNLGSRTASDRQARVRPPRTLPPSWGGRRAQAVDSPERRTSACATRSWGRSAPAFPGAWTLRGTIVYPNAGRHRGAPPEVGDDGPARALKADEMVVVVDAKIRKWACLRLRRADFPLAQSAAPRRDLESPGA